jgi:hypothetical protein
MMAEERCEYVVWLTDEEREGLEWLREVLKKIHEKGETHRSYRKALACSEALTLIYEHHIFMHARAHELEVAAGMHNERIAEIQMAWMPKGDA